MANWKGQSRGSLLGFQIYAFIIRKCGLYAAYFLLCFVAFYFFFFSFHSSKSTYYFFRRRLRYSRFSSLLQIYNSYFTFGKVLIDRMAIMQGMKNHFSFEFDGISHIKKLMTTNTGGILLTAHIGNFNMARYFFNEKHAQANIHLVVSDFEHEEIKAFLEKLSGPNSVNLIVLKEDFSHIFEMQKALENKELLVFAADRYLQHAKTYDALFLGENAKFPQGPFKLATRQNIPVLFIYVMREKNFHYHFYARPYKPEKNSAKEVLKMYLENLEFMVKKYPKQWYNYYDFWNEFS